MSWAKRAKSRLTQLHLQKPTINNWRWIELEEGIVSRRRLPKSGKHASTTEDTRRRRLASLYGCSLWSHSSSSLKLCEVALKKSLRKLWCLPRKSHSTIVHCVAQIDTISAIALSHFHSLRSSALSSSSPLVKSVISVSSSFFTGYNNVYCANHVIDYSYSDLFIAYMIRRIRYLYGVYSPCEDLISFLLCS